MSRADLHDRLTYALARIRGRTDAAPRAGVVLGSGLGRFASRLTDAIAIPYAEIPEFPISRVPGHAGRLVLGDLLSDAGRLPVAALEGRVHAYEGWTPQDVAFGARVLVLLGAKVLVVTNAAGGVNPGFAPGDLVAIEDHIDLAGQNPLAGPNDERLGTRFPDLTEAYDGALRKLLVDTAEHLGVHMKSGVYACMRGPSYETPAEVRMVRTVGGDLVGMSSVPEVIAARHMGISVVGVSLVANRAAGLSPNPLTHVEVGAVAERESQRLSNVLAAFLPQAVREVERRRAH